MQKSALYRRRHDLLSAILLAMLLCRAYVPVGFMPASGTPFLLELCPAGTSLPLPAQHAGHRHSDTHAHFENCPFGSAPAAGPVSHLVVFQPSGHLVTRASIDPESLSIAARLERAHQPRGPPSLS